MVLYRRLAIDETFALLQTLRIYQLCGLDSHLNKTFKHYLTKKEEEEEGKNIETQESTHRQPNVQFTQWPDRNRSTSTPLLKCEYEFQHIFQRRAHSLYMEFT